MITEIEEKDTVTVNIITEPMQDIGINIFGGTDRAWQRNASGDPGIFITRIRNKALTKTKQIREGARILEINGQSLKAIPHDQAVTLFMYAKGEGCYQLKLKNVH